MTIISQVTVRPYELARRGSCSAGPEGCPRDTSQHQLRFLMLPKQPGNLPPACPLRNGNLFLESSHVLFQRGNSKWVIFRLFWEIYYVVLCVLCVRVCMRTLMFSCLSMCRCMACMQELVEARRGHQIPLELELQAAVRCPRWALRSESRSSSRAASVLHHWTTSSVHKLFN